MPTGGNDGSLDQKGEPLPYGAGSLLVQESFKKLQNRLSEIQQKCDWKPRDAV